MALPEAQETFEIDVVSWLTCLGHGWSTTLLFNLSFPLCYVFAYVPCFGVFEGPQAAFCWHDALIITTHSDETTRARTGSFRP